MKKANFLSVIFLAMILCCAMSFSAWGADPIKNRDNWAHEVHPRRRSLERRYNGYGRNQQGRWYLGGRTKRPIELIKVDSNEFLSIPDARMQWNWLSAGTK